MGARKTALEHVSARSLVLHPQNFASAAEYLSFRIDSVGHYIRYANIKIFCEPSFPVYG